MDIYNDKREYNYKIEVSMLSEDDGGGFIATVPALPGCMSDGETQEEALINAKDAIKSWLETATEAGRRIPEEDKYRSEDDYSGKLSLRIPQSLHKHVSERAIEEGCSINQLIMMYISMGIGCEFGKKQVNIKFNFQNNELPILGQLERDTWQKYQSTIGDTIDPLNLVNVN